MPSSESQVALNTRRSIKKHFPLGPIMASGCDNPISLHSVDDQLFVRIWSLIAETMCVTVELSRTTKEAVATLVSERNTCPVCICAHTMMSVVSITVDTDNKKKPKAQEEREAKQHEQALAYAGVLLDQMKGNACGTSDVLSKGSGHGSSGHFSMSSGGSTCSGGDSSSKKSSRKGRNKNKNKYSHLSQTAMAEVALVVLLFDHMNRVVSVVMGEEMSTAMFSVPRGMAKAMEKPSTIRVMSKLMSPFMSGAFKTKHNPGMTLSLFPEEKQQGAAGAPQQQQRKALPAQLQGVLLSGLERANAVGRLVDWVDTFEQSTLASIMPPELISFLDRETKIYATQENFDSPGKVLKWVENSVRDEISTEMDELELDETGKAIAMVLLLSTFAPQTAYQSTHWDTLVDQVGQDTARSVVAWWSLRLTLRQAKGLDTKIDAQTMIQIVSGGLVPQ